MEPSDLERQAEFDMLLAGMCEDRDPYRHTDKDAQTHRHPDKDTQTKNWREWATVGEFYDGHTGAHNDREFYDGQVYTHVSLQNTLETNFLCTCTHTHIEMVSFYIYIS